MIYCLLHATQAAILMAAIHTGMEPIICSRQIFQPPQGHLKKDTEPGAEASQIQVSQG